MSDEKRPLKGLEVIIENEETGAIEASYFIRKMTVAASARRYALFEQIKDANYPPNKMNQLVYCANMSTVLCNLDGELIYPEPVGVDEDDKPIVDTGYLSLYDDFDEDIFFLLVDAYGDINPVTNGMKTKKKRY